MGLPRVALPVVGFSPAGVTGLSTSERAVRGVLATVLLVHLVLVVVTALKGKSPDRGRSVAARPISKERVRKPVGIFPSAGGRA